MNKTLKMSGSASLLMTCMLIFLLLLILLLYTFTHEAGHALFGLLFGGKINAFSVNFFNLSAHVGIDGDFTPRQNALISVAGVSLPLLLCMGLILLVPKKVNPILNWFRLIAFMATVGSLLAYIVIPVLVLSGKTVGDDSVNFLGYTHLHPLLLTGAALLVFLCCWAVFLSRMDGFRGLLAQCQPASFDLTLPGTQKTIFSLASVGILVLAGTFILTWAYPDRTFEAPAGYQFVGEINLASQSYIDQNLYRFTLDEPSKVSFFFSLKNVKGSPAKIQLTGHGGYENTFFAVDQPQFNAGRSSVHPKDILLDKGDYWIRVTFQQSPGQVRAFIKVD